MSRLDHDARRQVDAISRLARAIADGDADALDRLGLSRRLEASSERLVEDLVAAARRHGATWQQIGDELGIPRQTAHRRYRAKA